MTAPAKRSPGRPRVGEGETVRRTVRLPEAVDAALEREAERLETSAAELVREAIEAHLPRVRRRARLLAESAPPEGPDVVR